MVTMNNLVQLKGKPPGYREYFENCFIVCACSCLHDQVWMQAINAFFQNIIYLFFKLMLVPHQKIIPPEVPF